MNDMTKIFAEAPAVLPVAPRPDADILEAFDRRQAAYVGLSALPEDQMAHGAKLSPAETRLWDIIGAAEENIRAATALTPRGVMAQLFCALYHIVSGIEEDDAVTRGDLDRLSKFEMEAEGKLVVSALRSLDQMGRKQAGRDAWPVSPAMRDAWKAWREHDERYQLAATDEECDALIGERDELHAAVNNVECSTPGDFILKQYLRLSSTLGSTLYGDAKDDLTGNLWDIDIDGDQYDGKFEAVEHPACYRDIDATDVGANLLAYGQPYFDAEAWMERADAIGLTVYLIQQQDGTWLLCEAPYDAAATDSRIRRERDRLRRILANDYGGTNRVCAICDEIRREWPQLVLVNPLTERPQALAA